MKHTPGPWQCDVNGIVTTFSSRWAETICTTPIAWIENKLGQNHDDEVEVWLRKWYGRARANALLIESSPDLLDLASSIVDFGDDIKTSHPDIFEQAKAIIHKVEGE